MTLEAKTAEFFRINEPRAARAVAQINHLAKSANSMKAHELDVAACLLPVWKALDEILDADALEQLLPHVSPMQPIENKPASTDRGGARSEMIRKDIEGATSQDLSTMLTIICTEMDRRLLG